MEGEKESDFKILGIMSQEERNKRFFPSYWRNEKTGNWDIAFFDDFVIYKSRFWNYKSKPVQKDNVGAVNFVITNSGKELQVSVSKEKKGKRTIQIGNESDVYSLLNGRTLPDYPQKDERSGFVNTNYKSGDSVTITGWLKDCYNAKKRPKYYKFMYSDELGNYREQGYAAPLDSLGRFSVNIPLINSTEFFCDWERTFLQTLFEPGKEYFFLFDFDENRWYVMGDDARLQNELMRFPLDGGYISNEEIKNGVEAYIHKSDSLLKSKKEYIDSLCVQHPYLSNRFKQYRYGNTLCNQATEMVHTKWNTNWKLLPEVKRYIDEKLWGKMEEPYTLHRECMSFLLGYIECEFDRIRASAGVNILDKIDELVCTDADRKLAERVKAIGKVPAELSKEFEMFVQRKDVSSKLYDMLFYDRLKKQYATLDSLGCDDNLKDIMMANTAMEYFKHDRCPLQQNSYNLLKEMVKNPDIWRNVEMEQEKYVAIENKEFDKVVLKSSEDLQNITEGEALLKKIIAPYKGRFVVVDVWGTWCAPCKEALSHSKELYSFFANYPMAYVYLANSSPQESWENVIKEYDVVGDNVAHYNLSAVQQETIERYLKVNSYPSYFLFDREGNLVNLKIDVRDKEDLEKIIKKMMR